MATSASLLLLPEEFTEVIANLMLPAMKLFFCFGWVDSKFLIFLLLSLFVQYDLYAQICSLSYMGDLRMLFAEDKDKVSTK